MKVYGIDVSKSKLVIADGYTTKEIPNDVEAITAWLNELTEQARIGLESTGKYHKACLKMAHSMGHICYELNPYDVSKYAQSLSRCKTDFIDSMLIQSYVEAHHKFLRPYVPISEDMELLKDLARLRNQLVKKKMSLKQAISNDPMLEEITAHAKVGIKESIARLDKEINKLIKKDSRYKNLKSIPGVSTQTIASALCALSGRNFKSSDAFVAFLGLDLCARDSGQKTGRRYLSKKGDPFARRNLYMAAKTAVRCDPVWKAIHERLKQRGFSPIQAYVALSRKMARVIWSIYKSGTSYKSENVFSQRKIVSSTVEQYAQVEMKEECTSDLIQECKSSSAVRKARGRGSPLQAALAGTAT